VIQEQGGHRKTVAAGIAWVKALLPQVNACARSEQPISELVLALQCGGSDGWSGVTANPLLGSVVDRIVGKVGRRCLPRPRRFSARSICSPRG